MKTSDELKREVEKLRKALEYYANDNNWNSGPGGWYAGNASHAQLDAGYVARKALGKEDGT